MNNVNSPATKEKTISMASGANMVLGIWLIVSPWLLGYASQAAMWNNVIIGAVVVVLAWSRLAMRSRAGAPSWLNLLLGVWLIVAPFVFVDVTVGQRWNSIIVGALLAILALASGGAGAARRAP